MDTWEGKENLSNTHGISYDLPFKVRYVFELQHIYPTHHGRCLRRLWPSAALRLLLLLLLLLVVLLRGRRQNLRRVLEKNHGLRSLSDSILELIILTC